MCVRGGGDNIEEGLPGSTRLVCSVEPMSFLPVMHSRTDGKGAPLHLPPHQGQSLCCGGDDYEHSVAARPCRSSRRPAGHLRLLGSSGGACSCFLPPPPPGFGHGVCIWMHLVNGTGNSSSPEQPAPE